MFIPEGAPSLIKGNTVELWIDNTDKVTLRLR